jgi:serine/threonine protein kinase/Tol biopolymer transport system component
MNATTKCPDQTVFEKLVGGQLTSADASALEQHMLECEHCAKIADQLVSSAEITAMLAQVETGAFRNPEADTVERLIQQVQSLKPPVSAAKNPSNEPEQTIVGTHRPDVAGETAIFDQTFVGRDVSLTSFLRPAQQSDEIGRLGGYRILQILGSGGMGVVYRAEDLSLKRLVALKVMKPTVAANPDAKARFMKEAEATAAIEHDNIVTIYQVGEDNGIPFIAMQFLKGESLQARLDRVEKLPEAEALRIGLEVANGLQAAHSQGLIHRDIKPDNIWLQEGNDRVRILDFGLVRNSAEDAGLTQSGVVLGTPKYMAPEQARGHDVDHRCDLFSLGSVMYRMLAGKAPFEGSNLTATLIAVAHEDPKPLMNLAPEVSPRVAAMIDRLLAKTPADRPASARDVASGLDQLRFAPRQTDTAEKAVADPSKARATQSASAKHQHPISGTQSAGRDGKPPMGRRLAIFAGGFAALILLAVLIIRLKTKDGTIVIELDSAVPVTQIEIDGNRVKFTPDESGKRLTVSVPEGTHHLEIKTTDGISLKTELGTKPVEVSVSETTTIRAWRENTPAVADRSKNETSMAAEESSATKAGVTVEMQSGRNAEITKNDDAPEVPVNAVRKASTLWPAGPFPAWASEQPRWSIMKESDTIPGVVERPSEFKSVGRWNVDTIQSRGMINVARYSPDSKWLATGSTDGHVRVYDSASMKLHQLLPGIAGQQGAIDLSWHPDSQRIAVAADNARQLRIWTIDGQLLREELAGGDTYTTINSVAWTFDGSRLICGGANRLEVRDVDGTLLKALISGEQGPHCEFGSIAVSPDRQRFIAWQFDAARIWNAETFEMEATIPIPCSNGIGGQRVRWGSKDRILLSALHRLTICSDDGEVLQEFPNELSAAAWRPDGEVLTTWRWSLNDLNTTSEKSKPFEPGLHILTGGTGTIPTAFDWSPDGKRLVLAGGRLVIYRDGVGQLEYDSDITLRPVSCISLNPDGNQIASVSQISDDCVRLWSSDGSAQSSMPLNEMMLGTPRVAWSPDGHHVAAGWPQSSHFRIGKPGGDFLSIAGQCFTLAWNPEGTQLAAGLTNGHILITDTDGKVLHDLETGETGAVNVGWSKQGILLAHAGKKILRVDPSLSDSKISLLTNVRSGPSDAVAVWRPDGSEVSMGNDLHVNVTDGVAERIRLAAPAVAWAPDGSKCLFPMSVFTSLVRPDGNQLLGRLTNASTTMLNGAWSPSGESVYVGYDESLLVARSAEDLHVKWSAVILPKQKSVTFHVGGSVLDADRDTLEREFVYYAADEKGNVRLLSPVEFELQTGEEILPVPRRYFDSEYRFAVTVGTDWKQAPLDVMTVPGIARAVWSRPGGVSLSFFVQETGAYIDPSYLLAESAKAQEEKLSATVVEKEIRQIAGRDAMWMLIEGQGTGSAITGNGPVKTTQHWIAIPRENDVLVALLTTPSGSFQSNQKLFLKAIETLQLRK